MMRFTARVLPAVACCASLLLTLGPRARAETLAETFAETLNNSPELAAHAAHLQQSREKIRQAQSHWRPDIAVDADSGPHRFRQFGQSIGSPFLDQNDTEQNATQQQHDVSVNLSESIYRGGRTLAETRQSRAEYEAERARTLAAEVSTLLQAASSYVDVLRDRKIAELQVDNERLLRATLEGTRRKFQGGQFTRTDVAQAEARLAGGVADRQEAEGNLRASSTHFESVVGHAPGVLEDAPEGVIGLPQDLASAERVLEVDNPELLAATYDEAGAKYAIDLARGALLPTVSLQVEASRNDNALIRTPQLQNPKRLESLAALLRVTVPLYDGGQGESATRAARQAHREAMFSTEATRRARLDTLRSAWTNLDIARARLISLEQQVASNEVAVQGATAELAGGTRTLLDVLDTQRDLLHSRLDLTKTRHDAMLAEFEIASAIGALRPQLLGIADKDGLDIEHFGVQRSRPGEVDGGMP